jgi:hypothetical protein
VMGDRSRRDELPPSVGGKKVCQPGKKEVETSTLRRVCNDELYIASWPKILSLC